MALLATASMRLSQILVRHVTAEITAEQAATETADATRFLMDGLNILDGEHVEPPAQ